MVDLPPITTRLTGDVEPLARAFAEAETLAEVYGRVMGEKVERGGGDAGRRGGHALVSEMEKEVGKKDPTQSLLSRIVSSAKSLELTDAGKKLGVDFGRGWIQGIASIFDNPVTIGIGAVVVIPLISEALAGLGGLITTALGLGGITAGIVGSLKDPAVKDAITGLGHDAMSVLATSTSSELDPIYSAVTKLDNFLKAEGPAFAAVYQPIAKVVGSLENGVEAMINRALPGLTDGMTRAGPVVDAFAKELPEIGSAVGDFLEKLTASQGGNIAGLTAIVDLIDMAIRGTGNLIEAGSHVYAAFLDVIKPVADLVDNTIGAMLRAIGQIPVIGEPFKAAGDYMHNNREEADKLWASMHQGTAAADSLAGSDRALTDAMKAQKAELDTVISTWDKWSGAGLTLDNAVVTYRQDLLNLTEAVKGHTDAFDMNTKAGLNNYQLLLQTIQAAKDQYNAEVASGKSVDQASKAFQAQIDYLLGMAQKAGLSKDQLNLLTTQVGQLRSSLDSLNGTTAQWWVVGHWVPPTGNQFSSIPFMDAGGLVRAADGLLPARSPGTLVLAGEPQTKGEWMIPRAGISQQRAQALIGGAAADHGLSVGGGGDIVVNLRFQIGDAEFYEQVVLPGKKKFDKNYGTST